MNTTNEQTVTEYEQHQLDMLLWQADVFLVFPWLSMRAFAGPSGEYEPWCGRVLGGSVPACGRGPVFVCRLHITGQIPHCS